ncbi:MAG: hypothetical protein ABTR92_19675 [Candidatus Accumulibacter phosphatis]
MNYSVERREVKSMITGQVKAITYCVVGTGGLYGTLSCPEDAALVAFGLNNKFLQSQFGGFSDDVAAEIRKAMAGETPAAWSIEDSE